MYAAMVLPKRQRTTFYATRWNMAPNYLPPLPPSSVRKRTQDGETRETSSISDLSTRIYARVLFITFPLIAELPTVQLDHIERKDQWAGPKAQICLLREGRRKKEKTGDGEAAFIDVFFCAKIFEWVG